MSTNPTGRRADDAERPARRALIQERLRILRLLRALDRAGVNPEEEVDIRMPLVRLSEIDGFLTAMLELVERDGGEVGMDPEARAQIQSILPIAESLRGDVRDAVPPRLQTAVRRASTEVAASEAEILLELDAFRRDAAESGKRSGPISDAEAQDMAEKAWAENAPAALFRADRRVSAHERKALPDPEDPLRAWFDRTPRPWREAMARYHGIPRKGGGALALRLAERVSDPVWMRHFLTDRFGASEREMLARFLANPVSNVDPGDEVLRETIYVSWDWARYFPASVGGKLRAAGLVHVGSEAGQKLAIVPPTLIPLLGDLLSEVDPESAALPERARRQAQAALLRDAPFEDELLAHWKQADQDLSGHIERWILGAGDDLRGAIDAVFQDGERVVYSPEESIALFEYAIFDWRETPEQPTLAERLIPDEDFGSPEERTLAVAISAALPTFYRIEGVDHERSVTLTPLFPDGQPVVVTDRGLSLTVEPGQLAALRVYPAGPFHFVRLVGPALESSREKVVVRALRRELRAFVRDGGADDPATFLRERPWVLLRLMRRLLD